MISQFVLNLDKRQQRPVILLDGLSALLDTGAYVPVWIADERVLRDALKAVLVKRDVTFSGFGGDTTGNLYRVPTFTLGSLIFSNMHIIASPMNEKSFSLILSATMFSGLSYEINDKTHKFTVTVPSDESYVRNLVIKDSNGKLYVLCNSAKDNVSDIVGAYRELYKEKE